MMMGLIIINMKKRERKYIFWRGICKRLDRYDPFENIPVSAAFKKAFDEAIKQEFDKLPIKQPQNEYRYN